MFLSLDVKIDSLQNNFSPPFDVFSEIQMVQWYSGTPLKTSTENVDI